MFDQSDANQEPVISDPWGEYQKMNPEDHPMYKLGQKEAEEQDRKLMKAILGSSKNDTP